VVDAVQIDLPCFVVTTVAAASAASIDREGRVVTLMVGAVEASQAKDTGLIKGACPGNI
jgi:hypothetical protein